MELGQGSGLLTANSFQHPSRRKRGADISRWLLSLRLKLVQHMPTISFNRSYLLLAVGLTNLSFAMNGDLHRGLETRQLSTQYSASVCTIRFLHTAILNRSSPPTTVNPTRTSAFSCRSIHPQLQEDAVEKLLEERRCI